jgi:hypothetical protein
MALAWWQRRTADGGRPGSDREDVLTASDLFLPPIVVDRAADLPLRDPDEWTFPVPDCHGPAAADEPIARAAAADPTPGRPFFAFDDAGAPGGDAWRSRGWWLRAEPQPQRHFIAAAAKPVPALLRAWTFTDPAAPPLTDAPPRGADRIALLRDLRGRFDPDQVAGLVA